MAYSFNATTLQYKHRNYSLNMTTWVILTHMVLNERTQTQKSTYCMTPSIQGLKTAKCIHDVKSLEGE